MLETIWGKASPHSLLVGLRSVPDTLEISLRDSSNSYKSIYHITQLCHPLAYIQMTEQHPSDPCSPRFIAPLFTVDRKRKQPTCLPTDE